MLLVVLLASAALFLTTLANIQSRQRDKEAAERALINQCHAINQGRSNTYNSNMALATMAVLNAPNPIQELPPLIRDFVRFTQEAYESLNCDPRKPNFAVDPTPPTALAEHPLIEAVINESSR